MKEWNEKKLSEFMDFNPSTSLPVGSIAKKVSMEHLIPFTRKIQGYEETVFTGGTRFKNGDTLVARITPCLENGKTAYVDFLDDEEIAFGSTEFIVLRAKKGVSDSKFIFYFALSDEFRDMAIQLMSGTSGRQRVETEALKKKIFILPPLYEQRAIAEVLSSLDDKIDLLTRQNKTLEDLAQAYFRKLFIEDASKEWEEKSLYEVVDILSGGTPSTKVVKYWDGTIPWFTPKDAINLICMDTERHITQEGLNNCNSRLYPAGTVFISARGTVGKLAINGVPMAINQSCYALIGKGKISNFIVYLILSYVLDKLLLNASGAVFDAITTDTFKVIKLPLPQVNDEYYDKANHILSIYYEKIVSNTRQISLLQKIRDILLPKLISGEIRVKM
jgi:type I restriction enzyme S subunit